MKFKFPLQKVLDHRKIKEDLAQKDFQDAMSELQGMQKKLTEMETQIRDAHLRAFRVQDAGGAAGPTLSQVDEFIRSQKVLIQKQRGKITVQEKVVEEKRDLLRQAVVDTKVIDKLKEKRFEEFKKKIDMDEQKEMDEQSILRFETLEKKEAK